MAETAFALVDVFSDGPLSGNPLAVVPDADGLSTALMARIAREFNQAETTFLLGATAAGADRRLRSFTQGGVEVTGVGHNALGAWWWLAAAGRLGPLADVTYWRQQLGDVVSPLEIRAERGVPVSVALRQQAVQLRRELDEPAALADALGVDRAALGAADGLPAAQVVWTGAPHLMIGLRGREYVDAATPQPAALRRLLRSVDGQGCYLYALDPAERGAHAHARFFNPSTGIVEDPATGSAAGPLAGLLHRYGLVGDRAVIVQGHALGRPSRIVVDLSADPVLLGGAVVSATGTLRLP